MKRYIKEYASDILKANQRSKEDHSDRIKNILFYAEKQMITEYEAMKELLEIHQKI